LNLKNEIGSDIFPKLFEEKFMTSVEIVEKAKVFVAKEREATGEVLKLLRVIEDRKIYAELGFPSLWEFSTKYLGYDEGQTYRRIAAMKLIKNNPQVEKKIESGKMSLTTAARVHTFIKKTKIAKEVVLRKIEGQSTREVERTLLELAPDQVRPEQVRAVTKEHTEIRIVANNEHKGLLDKLRALRSHKNPGMGYGELIADMAKLAERHWDPALKRSAAKSAPKSKSRAIPSAVRSEVWRRDGGKCTQCGSRHLLEMDHIVPWAQGGTHDPKNLRLLCRTHNQLRSGQWIKL
jgi:hypothetical protein